MAEDFQTYSKKQIQFVEVNKLLVDKFTNWLVNKKNYSTNYAGKQLEILKTVCIDNWRDNNNQGRLGGAHLNTGGVASMTLLDSAKMYHQLKHEAKKHKAFLV